MKGSYKRMNGSFSKAPLICATVLFSLLLFHTPPSEAGKTENGAAEELERIRNSVQYVKKGGKTLYLRLKSGYYVILANMSGCGAGVREFVNKLLKANLS